VSIMASEFELSNTESKKTQMPLHRLPAPRRRYDDLTAGLIVAGRLKDFSMPRHKCSQALAFPRRGSDGADRKQG
jgi:hypothetical protein